MKQITIQVQDDQQVEKIKELLTDFDFVQSIKVDTLWFPNKPINDIIKIIESNIGPMISQSRVSVYDVMEAYDEGYSIYEIYQIYNLSSQQIDVALEYIAKHRATLEPKLKEIQAKLTEREQYHRALIAEREKQVVRPMTPERIKFNELLEKSRRSLEVTDANHTL